jgi:hypothetical protein
MLNNSKLIVKQITTKAPQNQEQWRGMLWFGRSQHDKQTTFLNKQMKKKKPQKNIN